MTLKDKLNGMHASVGGSTKPGRAGNYRHFPGATIGDGLRTTARWGGVLLVAKTLLGAGPVIAIGIVGCVSVLRGCLMPQVEIPPANPVQALVQSPSVSAGRNPTPHAGYQLASARAEPSFRPLEVAVDQPARQEAPEAMVMGQPPIADMPFDTALPTFEGFPSYSGSMLNTLADPVIPVEPAGFEVSPLFDFRQGRKFSGTSQMPGRPSQRIRLTVGAIREQGSNVEAKLSQIRGRVTKEFTGFIEHKPARLVLQPYVRPGNIRMFLTHAPWHSTSPTQITLDLSADGKTLHGRSVAGEQFYLTPDFRITTSQQPQVNAPEVPSFSGFGDTLWHVESKNTKPLESQETWEFTEISGSGGSFDWKRGGQRLASGTYLQDVDAGTLDIIVLVGGRQKVYRGRFQHSAQEVQVVIPNDANGKRRPSSVSVNEGNVFDLRGVE